MADHFEFTTTGEAWTATTTAGSTTTLTTNVTNRLGERTAIGFAPMPADGLDPAWVDVAPRELTAEDGEIVPVDVTLTLPDDAPSGELRLALQAFEVAHPQDRFATSPQWAVTVEEPDEPNGPPLWLIILIAALVVLVVGAALFFLLRSSGGTVPELAGVSLEEARGQLGDLDVVEIADGTLDVQGGGGDAGPLDVQNACVLLHSPGAGSEAESVTLLVTSCPREAPSVPVPAAGVDPCAISQAMCDRLAEEHGSEEAVAAAIEEQVQRFVDRFTVPGEEVQSVVGVTRADAEASLEEAGFEPLAVDDNTGAGSGCVLLQFPSGSEVTVAGGTVALVTTSCPALVDDPAAVALTTPIDVPAVAAADGQGAFGNLCDAAPDFCAALDDAPTLPRGYLGEEGAREVPDELRDRFANQVALFRNTFAPPRVPNNLIGQTIGSARTVLEELGLTVIEDQEGDTCTGFLADVLGCTTRVIDLNPPGGTLVADVPGSTIAVDFLRVTQTLTANEFLFEELEPRFDP